MLWRWSMQIILKWGIRLSVGLGLLATVTGCAGRWDVPTTELRKLQGYRDGHEVTLRDTNGDAVGFNQEKAIDIAVTGFRGPEIERVRFSSIRRADETVLEGTFAPRVPCSSWVGVPSDDPGSACSPAADGAYDLRGIRTVRIVRVDKDPPWKPAPVDAPQQEDHTGLVVGVSVGGTLGIATIVGIVYLVKGINDLHSIGGNFTLADAYRGRRAGRAH